MQVLVVEDDPTTAQLLEQAIQEEGYAVAVASDGQAALEMARSHPFDVIVLDIMLPVVDGFSVARTLREEGHQTPILILTARDSDRDVIHGLNLGADDYLTKPFGLDVFFARLRAVARRGPVSLPPVLAASGLKLDTTTREVWRDGRAIALTRTERSLLELLMRNAGRVVPRERIIETVWGFGATVESNTLDAFVHSLRMKVDSFSGPRLIQTVRGVGYSLREQSG